MISADVKRVWYDEEERYIYEFRGLSTDEKPEPKKGNGSTFFEIDTGDLYCFDEENGQWIQVGE